MSHTWHLRYDLLEKQSRVIAMYEGSRESTLTNALSPGLAFQKERVHRVETIYWVLRLSPVNSSMVRHRALLGQVWRPLS